jgi:hypothetical protein
MITIAGTRAPFGTDLLYTCTDLPQFVVHSEICEDVWDTNSAQYLCGTRRCYCFV